MSTGCSVLPLARCPLQLSSEVMQGREDVGEDVTVILPLGILLKKRRIIIKKKKKIEPPELVFLGQTACQQL